MLLTNDNFIMLPTVDFCFKELMQNPKVRKGFIGALLDVPPESIHKTVLMPTHLSQASEDEKLGILDVRVLLEDDTQMDMEMQVAYFEHWDKRILFYLGKMYTGQLRKGESYEKLKKCIYVSILDFVYFPDDDICYRTIRFCDGKTGKVYTDLLEIQILELKKLPRRGDRKETIFDWIRFFSGRNREEFEQMAKTNEYLDEAYQTLVTISADEEKRLEYEARERALKDYNTQMSSALKRGERIGRELGEKIGEKIGEERARQVFKLYMQGKPPEEIADICGISKEKVLELLE